MFGWALVDAATRAMLPFITGIGVRGEHTQLKFITVIAAKVSTVAAVCFSLGVWVLGPVLMQVWLKKDVFLGLPIVTVLSLIFIFDSPAAVFTNISIATERHRTRAMVNLAYAVTACFGGAVAVLLAPPENKILAMFLGFFAAALVFHFLVYPVVMRKDLDVPFRVWLIDILLRPLVFFGGCIGLVSLLRSVLGESLGTSLLSAAIVAVGALAFVAFGLFRPDEKLWLGRRLRISRWQK